MVPIRRHDMLGMRWKKRPMTASEYLAFSKGLLQKLMQFDPLLDCDWIVCGSAPRYGRIAADMSDFDDMAFTYLFNKKRAYLNPDPDSGKLIQDKALTLDSRTDLGFSLRYRNREELNSELGICIVAGDLSQRLPSVVNIEFRKNHPRRQDYAYLSALMKLLIEHCQPDYGFMSFGREGKAPGQPKNEVQLTQIFPIGWLTYLSDPTANQRLPDDIEREVLVGGGTLITLKRSLPSPDNAADVATATRIRDALAQPDMVDLNYLSETHAAHTVADCDS